ncbi:MAG: hypothetical protein ABW182_09800 [Sphingomonas sp.]
MKSRRLNSGTLPMAAAIAALLLPTVASARSHAPQGGLAPLSQEDIDSIELAGELTCSFFAKGSDAPLLLAKGDVASASRAQGAVKLATSLEPVSAPGGFDAMSKGTRFDGKGMTITIRVTGPATDAGESPARPATLAYAPAGSAQRSVTGLWVCGP